MYELMPEEKKFVQIMEIRDDGFVEFNFAIGEAAMNVELILPYKAFIEFCQNNRVSFFTKEQDTEVLIDNENWQFGIN
ncbi:phenol hydroxylase subunit [Poseidonibacter ostreae]|uniref:Phenol hydroxylase n=1 Tax=Poseidonibacter ostreae TaxID=2654171 RepID=A0A6L4WSU9_9BACT|nr:phenol hydroxylase subunit [Poseidonibacter ostreae]KAB7889108.1 phenol hydroxylase [Poseidonibacter ostreae]KAB7891753.1 phenol hydroxylase [Poseidonibacter ostreae]MAD41870.1 phenol hydroxylase [Arcobacter sp.]|tara:strand:+ start:3132 stop:3365 length:234 start_codon:yes stop_codon:yes gene_type:complete